MRFFRRGTMTKSFVDNRNSITKHWSRVKNSRKRRNEISRWKFLGNSRGGIVEYSFGIMRAADGSIFRWYSGRRIVNRKRETVNANWSTCFLVENDVSEKQRADPAKGVWQWSRGSWRYCSRDSRGAPLHIGTNARVNYSSLERFTSGTMCRFFRHVNTSCSRYSSCSLGQNARRIANLCVKRCCLFLLTRNFALRLKELHVWTMMQCVVSMNIEDDTLPCVYYECSMECKKIM